MAEDEMVGWHHQLNGHEFEQTLGDNEGQGSLSFLVCCNLWGCKESYTTGLLNNNVPSQSILHSVLNPCIYCLILRISFTKDMLPTNND